jgi:hypothetical protein
MSEVATTPQDTIIEPAYKIINLKANNFLKLKAIDITPGAEQVIEITGLNGAGKSSVLKAIWAAFANRDLTKEISSPIRSGESTGSVSVNLGDLIVTRSWTESGTYLQVENADGLIFKSPQAMLDKLKTTLTFDPLAFTRMAAKDQRATLIKLLGIDTDSLDADRETRYNTRTEINRKLKEAEGQLSAFQATPADTPDAPISPVDLIRKIREAEESNTKLAHLEEGVENLKGLITRLEREMAEAREALENQEKDLTQITFIDTAPLEEQLSSIEEINRDVERKRQQNVIMKTIRELSEKSDDLTDEIQQLDEQKRKKLQAAVFPIEGLSFDATGVLFNGIPMSQISSAEQIKISVAMGMAMKPGLRVMLIEDGSLLDTTSRQTVETLAKEYDMQVWLETVDDDDGCKIVIEDGEIVSG